MALTEMSTFGRGVDQKSARTRTRKKRLFAFILSLPHAFNPRDIPKLSAQDTMAAINKQLIATRAVSELVKRKNWAAREPGVIVVFCIVFIVAVGLLGLFIHKQCAKRRASKSQI
ncbi:hypothetical protein A0O28_0099210 [Trichoderma guizhouense]|nr:hypothetical protein A0O28_0099210 [Trichoderma guizhouense]